MTPSEKAVDAALQLEVKKHGLVQLQTGEWKLTLSVHPSDMPKELLTAPMGQRAVLAMVLVDDHEEPIVDPEKQFRRQQQSLAHTLPKNERFRSWFGEFNEQDAEAPELTEEECVHDLREYLGILTRKEIANNRLIAERMASLVHLFKVDMGWEKP